MGRNGIKDNSARAFLALLKGGLWENDVHLLHFGALDFQRVYQLAEEQSVVGAVAAGIEHVVDVKIPKADALTFVGNALQLEQQNLGMNSFIAKWIDKLRTTGINALLIKGQGVAQCYERPLWRACGDIDLLLSQQSYDIAKHLLAPYTQIEAKETISSKEYCLTIEDWTVELHGSLHCRLTKRLDFFLDKIQDECCNQGLFRVWNNSETEVLLPSADNDVFVIFTHIVKHFFREGVGLRQLCDWCRLMWTFREEIDRVLLEKRLKEAGIVSEWKAFAALAVEWLGMPVGAMPLHSSSRKWKRKAKRIMALVLETGNFGHNKDFSYFEKYPHIVVKMISLWRHTWDLIRQYFIFPMDSVRVWGSMVRIGVDAMKKEK